MRTHIEIPTEDEAWRAFDEFMANWAKTIDLEMALLDPERVFESPQGRSNLRSPKTREWGVERSSS